MVERENSLLRCAPPGSARHHRLGSGPVQVWQYARGCSRETTVRLVLYQERVSRSGFRHHVPHHQDCCAGSGRTMKWVFWCSAAVIAYTYLGYVAWLWVRVRLCAKPAQHGPHEASISIVMVVRNEER